MTSHNRRSGDHSVGVVVKVDKANSSTLSSSRHTAFHLHNSPDIYYVFFTDQTPAGPYYASELIQWS